VLCCLFSCQTNITASLTTVYCFHPTQIPCTKVKTMTIFLYLVISDTRSSSFVLEFQWAWIMLFCLKTCFFLFIYHVYKRIYFKRFYMRRIKYLAVNTSITAGLIGSFGLVVNDCWVTRGWPRFGPHRGCMWCHTLFPVTLMIHVRSVSFVIFIYLYIYIYIYIEREREREREREH
jgi:hypothetical protein